MKRYCESEVHHKGRSTVGALPEHPSIVDLSARPNPRIPTLTGIVAPPFPLNMVFTR